MGELLEDFDKVPDQGFSQDEEQTDGRGDEQEQFEGAQCILTSFGVSP